MTRATAQAALSTGFRSHLVHGPRPCGRRLWRRLPRLSCPVIEPSAALRHSSVQIPVGSVDTKNPACAGSFVCWRRERDSNPRWAFDPYSLSRGAPSATRPPLRFFKSALRCSLIRFAPPGARYSGLPALHPCGAVLLRFDVPIRSRRIGQPLGHLSVSLNLYFVFGYFTVL